MTAQPTDRKLDGLGHDPIVRRFRLPVAAATLLYSGALVMGNATGYAANAVEGAGNGDLVVHGIACKRVDNSGGAAGDLSVDIERTVADFASGTGTNAITIADVGRMAYAIDNQTVSRHNGGNTRPCVGRIHSITATGRIMVEVGSHAAGDPVGESDLVFAAGADLSDAQYHFVKLDGSGDVVLCSAAGEEPLGVLQNAPEATEPAIVRWEGVTQLVGSTNLAVGARVATTNAGRAKAVVTGRTDTSDAGAANDPLIGSHACAILLGAISGNGVAAKALLRFSGSVPQTAS